MPLAFRPDKTQAVSLSIDLDMPAELRPEFLVRFVTEGDAQSINAAWEVARKAKSDDECSRIMRETLAAHIAGWRNFPPAAGPWIGADSLKPLTFAELSELRTLITSWATSNAPFTVAPSASP